jgi:hypothetical protein
MVERKKRTCAAIAGLHSAARRTYMRHRDDYDLWSLGGAVKCSRNLMRKVPELSRDSGVSGIKEWSA